MLTVLRLLFVIPLGFVAACLAAAGVLIGPFLGPLPAWSDDPLYLIELGTAFAIQAMQVGSVAFLPWLGFVAVTELLGLSSLILHVLAGLGGAFAVLRLAYDSAPPSEGVRNAVLVAGLAFALLYWLLAGHGAGGWRAAFQRDEARRIETAKPEKTEAKT
ncbi:hypothetical protein GCM10011390_29690 [Aureimonas endophytica]|uniref:Uncharacterized protein n=1 Tax=Aureimonas endophytica TaxID=2027858 RepID=A0A916ZQ67_9HYPH|nr:hypothetical protein [Aureimonas endophytica]GGE08651.1 hypothetical protein GCM10011390_29690 [Aureimonas endophytica]